MPDSCIMIFSSRGLPLASNNIDISDMYTLPVELSMTRTDLGSFAPKAVSMNPEGSFVAGISSNEVRVLPLSDTSGNAATSDGADEYTSGWNGEENNDMFSWTTSESNDMIVAVDSDSQFVALASNVDDDDDDCTVCRDASLYFDDFTVRVFDVDARIQVAQTIAGPGLGWSVRENGVKLALGGTIMAVASVYGDESVPNVL